MQAGTAGVEVQRRRIVHDREADLVLGSGLLHPFRPVLRLQVFRRRLLDDTLAVGNGMQGGIQAVPLHRECPVHRDVVLPVHSFYAFEQFVKRPGSGLSDRYQHSLSRPEPYIGAGKIPLASLKRHPAVLGLYLLHIQTAQFVRRQPFQSEQTGDTHFQFHLISSGIFRELTNPCFSCMVWNAHRVLLYPVSTDFSTPSNHIRKRIEVVITGLTRNQVVLTGSWVRIPPLPPE